MGLPHGCSLVADGLFAKRHDTDQVYMQNNTIRSVIMSVKDVSCHMNLTYMRGDCTACTAHLECLQVDELPKMFTTIQEYMSINARISCMFTLKKQIKVLPEWIAALKKFPIAGLHLQKSNREPDSQYYMITGILKVPNPVINTYTTHNSDFPSGHNNNDLTKLNEINKLFGLPTF